MANASAGDCQRRGCKEAIQSHGGMGFTWEFDCHLYYRRSKLLALLLGSETRWKGLLVDRLAEHRQS